MPTQKVHVVVLWCWLIESPVVDVWLARGGGGKFVVIVYGPCGGVVSVTSIGVGGQSSRQSALPILKTLGA